MPAPVVNRYNLLAKHYDLVFEEERTWFDAPRERILRPILPEIASACDLACGTARTALILARRGLRVFGVDGSAEMCRVARENVRRARLPVRILRGDMRSFRLPEPVDLITCEFDALNHLARTKDLLLVARSAARALRPGGHFYFDVNTKLSLEKNWSSTWWIEKPGVVVVLHGGYDETRETAWSDVDWFIRVGRNWRRVRERVEEVAWCPVELVRTLRAAGFDDINAWDASRLIKNNPVMRRGHRTFYLARKRR